MKFIFILLAIISSKAFAESRCDIRPGKTIGVPVVEFFSDSTIHSKIPVKEVTSAAIHEEMINLQDMGVCDEVIPKRKCILKYEKIGKQNYLTLIRGEERWPSWKMELKKDAQEFTKRLQKAGFCQ